jgi:hypothetical protein
VTRPFWRFFFLSDGENIILSLEFCDESDLGNSLNTSLSCLVTLLIPEAGVKQSYPAFSSYNYFQAGLSFERRKENG